MSHEFIRVPLDADDERWFICNPNDWLRLRRTTPREIAQLGYREQPGYVNATLIVRGVAGNLVPMSFPYPHGWPLEDADADHRREVLEHLFEMDPRAAAQLRFMIGGEIEEGAMSASDGNTDFARAMGAVAREVLGKPNRVSDREMRFGKNDRIWINLTNGTWRDHAEEKGGGVLAFLLEHKGLDKPAALDWLKSKGLLSDKTEPAEVRKAAPAPAALKLFDDDWLIGSGHERVAIYDYAEEGEVLYQKVRYAKGGKKRFLIRHMGPDGRYYDGKAGAHGVLYRGDDLDKVGHTTVFVCEGEKDADNLAAHDMVAVSADNGSWTEDMIRKLAGFDCLILEDNDATGRQKAEKAAAALHGVAASVRVVRLPGLAEGRTCPTGLPKTAIRQRCWASRKRRRSGSRRPSNL
ncbi:hypothetical protein ACRAWG_15785 [Methylobacterium sp. P31]